MTDKQIKFAETLKQNTLEARTKLLQHPIYEQINSLDDLKAFMEHHVYAVWDFMSLLKFLQREFTTVSIPWTPKPHTNMAWMINEIVLGEESDVNAAGERMSHFQMYLQAMQSLGADTSAIKGFVEEVAKRKDIFVAIDELQIAEGVKSFLRFTFNSIQEAKPHVIASIFTFGREDLIPDMFLGFVKQLAKSDDSKVGELIYYLERHIELDGDEHAHLALEMTAVLCGDDELKWKEAESAAIACLQKRAELWDAVVERVAVFN